MLDADNISAMKAGHIRLNYLQVYFNTMTVTISLLRSRFLECHCVTSQKTAAEDYTPFTPK